MLTHFSVLALIMLTHFRESGPIFYSNSIVDSRLYFCITSKAVQERRQNEEEEEDEKGEYEKDQEKEEDKVKE